MGIVAGTSTLVASVGLHGRNRDDDVLAVQKLLNAAGADIEEDGDCGRATISAIEDCQRNWKVGPQQKASTTTWSKAVLVKRQRMPLDTTAQHTIRVPVDVKKEMDELGKENKWPFVLRVVAKVLTAAPAATIYETHADLPLKPGD